MTRNYEIAEFRETDDLGPTATRKLNSNFRNMLSVMRDMSVGGVDTGAIAAYVLDSVDDSIEDLDRRVDVLEQQGGGGTSGVSPSDADPAMDGTADAGSSTLFARGDHVHPTDTSRAANTDFQGALWGRPGSHGLVPAPPLKTGDQINNKYILLDDGSWHGAWMDLYFDSDNDEYKLRIRYMQADGITESTLWETTLPAVTSTNRGMMRASDKVNLDTLWNDGDYQSDWNQSDSTAADYIKNKPTLGTAAAKNVGSVADGNTGLVTGDAVYDAIQDALSDVAGALVYKGTAAIASAISGTSYKKGWYWIASATFALTSDINVEPGDMIIAKQDKTSTFASDIDVVQTNIDTLTEAEVMALWNAA